MLSGVYPVTVCREVKLTFKSILFAALIGLLLPGYSVAAEGNLQISYVDSRGNSDSRTFSFDTEAIHKTEKTKLELKSGSLFGANEGKETSAYWYTDIKDVHELEKTVFDIPVYWFIKVRLEGDKIAGYGFRLNLDIGTGYHLINTDEHKLDFEIGPGFVYEDRILDKEEDPAYASSRAYLAYKWQISEKIEFSASAEVLYHLQDSRDYRINSNAGLTGKITDNISLKIGPKLRYVNLPPEGKEKTDLITATTIIMVF